MIRRILLILALAALSAGAAASATPVRAINAPRRGVFVGRVAGSHAFVAIALGHGHVRGYVCDSRATAAWFLGAIREGRIDLHARGLRLRARLGASAASGTVTLADGRHHRFRAMPARGTGGAGLYRGDKTVSGLRYTAGWILLTGHAQRGNVQVRTRRPRRPASVQSAPTLTPDAASVEIAGAGQVDVVQLTDSFINPLTF